MDLYRILAKPLPPMRETGPVSMTCDIASPSLSVSTQFTETVESTDEERGGVLLGCVAP